MKARACLGIYAKNPYCFEQLGIEVFCMEELSYCLKKHAFLLGPEIMSDELLQFIGRDCQVPELAKNLYPMVHIKGSLSGFVAAILNYVGFVEEDDIQTVADTIRKSSGLTSYEKKKMQIDVLVHKKAYGAALDAYQHLIHELEPQRDNPKIKLFIGDLLHNCGVSYANMLLYEDAAGSFMEAYKIKGDKENLEAHFFAKRCMMSNQEYVSFATKQPEFYELSLEVEKKINDLQGLWEKSAERMGLQNMRHWRMTGDNHRYYEECEELVQVLKEEYRNCI